MGNFLKFANAPRQCRVCRHAQGRRAEATPGDVHSFHVLLVEDEFLLCDMLAEVLAEHGFAVDAVGNAEEALRRLTAGAACDILITDINLPGLDGEALARRARELRPGLPVVYASGSCRRLAELDAVPGAVLVAKPYNPEKLCAMVGQMTAGSH